MIKSLFFRDILYSGLEPADKLSIGPDCLSCVTDESTKRGTQIILDISCEKLLEWKLISR